MQKCLTDTERKIAMNDFCELIELTASELDEVAGGRRHGHGNSVRIDVDIDVNEHPRTTITDTVDNSVNIG
jgi:hypothetical protein